MKQLVMALMFAAFVAVPAAQSAHAASKRQATVYVCHLPDSTGRYQLINVARSAWNHGHGYNQADFLAPNGADTDCNAV